MCHRMPGNCQGLFRTTMAQLKYIRAVVQRYVLSEDNALKSIDDAILAVGTARRKVLREVRARERLFFRGMRIHKLKTLKHDVICDTETAPFSRPP